MKLSAIIDEITGAEQVRDSLIAKKDDLKVVQANLNKKIADQREKIQRSKELLKNRKKNGSTSLKEVSQDVSQVLRLAGGKVIGYVHTHGDQTRYFNRVMRLVAIETKHGTLSANGRKVSPDAIGLFILGLEAKKV